MTNKNKLVVQGVEGALNKMKAEIAHEFNVELGADTSSRKNGSVGGEMTKRLIQLGGQSLKNKQ